MKWRILCDIFLAFSFFWFPWYWTIIFVFIFMAIFHNFLEGIIVSFLIDILYSIPSQKFYGGFGIFTLGSLIIFFLLGRLKSNLRL